MDDPDNLMEGKGKVHRHVKLQRIEQVRSPELRELMLRALDVARQQYPEMAVRKNYGNLLTGLKFTSEDKSHLLNQLV